MHQWCACNDCATPEMPTRTTFTVSLTLLGMMMGDDPHFSVVLPSEKLLCFSVQGDHSLSYNLISNRMLHINAIFIPDSRREEVTWIGSLGIVVADSSAKRVNETSLLFEIKSQRVTINNKVKLIAKNIDKITISNGKLSISEAPRFQGFRYPKVLVNLEDAGLRFTVMFKNEHLDMFWHSTGQQNEDSHGLIGELSHFPCTSSCSTMYYKLQSLTSIYKWISVMSIHQTYNVVNEMI